MNNLTYETRLVSWKKFRDSLEVSQTPIQDCFEYWKQVPEVRYQADPYDQDTWPDPWQMINENIFCPFVKILAICYTLQLTEYFSRSNFEIHIIQAESNINYILTIDGQCAGYDNLSFKEISESLNIEKSYSMPPLL